MRRCMGECKRPYTRDFTPEVSTHPVLGWVFILHDTSNCPDHLRWQMDSIRGAAKRLRESRSN